jgi:hypothetical protein
VSAGWCDKAEALLASMRDKFPFNLKDREKRLRGLLWRARPLADKYQQELAAKMPDHPDTLSARLAFAQRLSAQSEASGAAYHFTAVRDVRQRLFGRDDPEAYLCALELAKIRLGQRKYAEAESLLHEGYQGLTQHKDKMPVRVQGQMVSALMTVVRFYDNVDKGKADEWRTKLEIAKKK